MATSCALYYFSATGNSLAVALELAQKLNAPEPVSIPGSLVLKDPYAASRKAEQVGFVFPIHRATLPEMVRGFIKQMPKRRDCYYFAVSTHTLFGCNEFWDIDELLSEGGGLLNYAAGVRTMGNIGLKDPNSKAMAHRLKQISEQLDEIAEAVQNHQENYFHRSFKLLSRLVRAYTDARRRSLVFKVNEHCTKCGICAQVCPAQNIIVSPSEGLAPIRSDRCEACFACIHWCPSNAIGRVSGLHRHYHHPHIKPEQLNPVRAENGREGAVKGRRGEADGGGRVSLAETRPTFSAKEGERKAGRGGQARSKGASKTGRRESPDG
jgi:ferredoxin